MKICSAWVEISHVSRQAVTVGVMSHVTLT